MQALKMLGNINLYYSFRVFIKKVLKNAFIIFLKKVFQDICASRFGKFTENSWSKLNPLTKYKIQKHTQTPRHFIVSKVVWAKPHSNFKLKKSFIP
jgi:hypothetical protein